MLDSSCPITGDEVAEVLGITIDSGSTELDFAINCACKLYDSCVKGTGDSTLESCVLLYLSAHFASLSDKYKKVLAQSEKLGDAQITFAINASGGAGGLSSTVYGQTALDMDKTGRLRSKTCGIGIESMGAYNNGNC